MTLRLMCLLVGGHVQVDGEVVVFGCTIELELRRVASSGNDLVALGKTLLDKFGAETCRGSRDEENFGGHFGLVCFEEMEELSIERKRECGASGIEGCVSRSIAF